MWSKQSAPYLIHLGSLHNHCSLWNNAFLMWRLDRRSKCYLMVSSNSLIFLAELWQPALLFKWKNTLMKSYEISQDLKVFSVLIICNRRLYDFWMRFWETHNKWHDIVIPLLWSIQTELMWDWDRDREFNQYCAEHFTLQLMWELKLDQDHTEITVQHAVSSPIRSPGKVWNGLETHSLSSWSPLSSRISCSVKG